ncbi:MAG: response regulator transcription factor [Phascolarctobacterium sp.]|nr:response regulator transcription factor [Phascolarctobacterium sp.]
MAKILVADDEQSIREILRIYLENEGYEVLEAEDGADALRKIELDKPDLVLLDIMMPILDGIEVCRQVRKHHDIPIIMATAKDADDDRILGLEMGADDYITKPFNNRELMARVKAVLRRSSTQQEDNNKNSKKNVTLDGLIIDVESFTVTAFGKSIALTSREFELLYHLASNPNKAFSRNQLLEEIWGYSYYSDTRTVDTHIKRVRQKLNIPVDCTWDIETVWGLGYKLTIKGNQ